MGDENEIHTVDSLPISCGHTAISPFDVLVRPHPSSRKKKCLSFAKGVMLQSYLGTTPCLFSLADSVRGQSRTDRWSRGRGDVCAEGLCSTTP